MIKGIHHVGITCRDMDRMIQFYREAFGFELRECFEWHDSEAFDRIINVSGSAARAVMMQAGHCCVELFEYTAPPPETDGPLRPQDRGYTHFCVEVTDIDAEYERLKGIGMQFGKHAPVEIGGSKALYGRDPEGNIIEILQMATREADG
ncbi:VOC family protein [Bradyrhizobium yuanmingense]|uniref:VOC family protein n=1 Tax=Bradyrhizobium yuanmingense TaxID=108015 RepID=UPI0023B8D4E8|nr:VOC family protein [Bradyrhizobium yuanmingense]MDF0498617.1 VOC family protein [Bradyrhizobium yuanmingense]